MGELRATLLALKLNLPADEVDMLRDAGFRDRSDLFGALGIGMSRGTALRLLARVQAYKDRQVAALLPGRSTFLTHGYNSMCDVFPFLQCYVPHTHLTSDVFHPIVPGAGAGAGGVQLPFP